MCCLIQLQLNKIIYRLYVGNDVEKNILGIIIFFDIMSTTKSINRQH